MQKVDPAYLFELGDSIRVLRELSEETSFMNAYVALVTAQAFIEQALAESIYSFAFRVPTRTKAQALLDHIKRLSERIEGTEEAWASKKLNANELRPMQSAYAGFETLFLADLQSTALYLVSQKNGFDTDRLVEHGHAFFPTLINVKAPESLRDLREAMRCIAFELPTAAGFHLHRANEAVLRRYWDAVTDGQKRPKDNNMGVYLRELERLGKGKKAVLDQLQSIKDFHRNPLMHPEQSLESVEEAIDLYSAIRSSIGYMLREIPLPPPDGEQAAAAAV